MTPQELERFERNKASRVQWMAPILKQTLAHIHSSGRTLSQLSVKSGVGVQTMRRWQAGEVISPNMSTCVAVNKACGFELTWKKKD